MAFEHAGRGRRLLGGAALACLCAGLHAAEPPAAPGIGEPPASSRAARHGVRWPSLQALEGKAWGDADVARRLTPALPRLFGARLIAFRAAMIDTKPLRVEGTALVAEGIVPDTLAYRGAFLALGSGGDLLGVIKGGRHGTTVERFGSLALLQDRAVLHAYQAFLGIDE